MANLVVTAAQVVWLLPRNALVLALRGYRKFISPLYGDVCRYYPTCSAYGLHAIQTRGVIVGCALTVARIIRCNPWSRGGVDDVPTSAHTHSQVRITKFGWVVPSIAPTISRRLAPVAYATTWKD
ncbi:MAG TPA: membrane protein insertion efficiency factor YidD [Candidatus Lumbricidophila sp.]|nr:membrane protein insertion efficiency factor YidD [Candidatus Lumbricidophila sp.]